MLELHGVVLSPSKREMAGLKDFFTKHKTTLFNTAVIIAFVSAVSQNSKLVEEGEGNYDKIKQIELKKERATSYLLDEKRMTAALEKAKEAQTKVDVVKFIDQVFADVEKAEAGDTN